MKVEQYLWDILEDIIISNTKKVGRKEKDNKNAFEGMLYVLKNGISWHEMPDTFGCPTTIHSKFMRWSRCGLFDKLMKTVRAYYRSHNPNNRWYAIDTSLHKASFAKFGGRNPVDRGRRGIKSVVMVDYKGAPLFLDISAANIHDSRLFPHLLSRLRTSHKARIIAADAAFDSKRLQAHCARKNIALLSATNPRRNKITSKYQPSYRWIIERTSILRSTTKDELAGSVGFVV